MGTKYRLFLRLHLGFKRTMDQPLTRANFVGDAILELLRDNSIEEVFSSPDIVNPLSVSVQSFDFRHINLHIYKQRFRCEDLHTIKNVFSKNFFVFSFDLKSGYHNVNIFSFHRKYLAFSRDFGKGHTRYFQFTVLPFGLSSAPFIFTKLLKTTGNPLEVTGDPYSHIF